ncbi:ammonium transporter [Tepidamorphus sp. 3E244]|uniref:ammonium transporter n=1 Tax=Tepidamorphus sp. 3E244 TaxID=3385498 RepID=UPI0038FC19B7
MAFQSAIHLIAVAAAFSATAEPAAADTANQSLGDLIQANSSALSHTTANLDMVWVLVAASLVLLMQVGFMLLEAGMVRSKNTINVAQKNMLDFTFSVMLFASVGFMFAFGASNGFWVGLDSSLLFLSSLDSWGLAFFTFQVMFCGTAATIVSGAVAERMPLTAYLLGSIVIAGFVYPVFVHWAWGTALVANEGAFLANMGFVDFAGSTVVHGTGAWVALAACLLIGARKGRFDENGRPIRIHGHSPVLATGGAVLLFVGWIGFNGGSTLEASPAIAGIIANTVLAAATGTAAGHALGWWHDRILLPEKSITGLLGGLVAVTAGAAVLTVQGAMLIGAAGGTVAVWGVALLERRFRIDDAVGAIGVHGFAGIVGTLGLALLAPASALPLGDRWAQFQVQALGVGLNFVWAFGVGLLAFAMIARLVRLRVTKQSEEIGLNETEHGTRIGIGHVEDAFGKLVEGRADLSLRLDIDEGDDAERLGRLFNSLMDTIEDEETAKSAIADKQRAEEEAERLSALANATFEGILIAVDGQIIDGNAALEELVGRQLSEMQDLRVSDLVHADSREVFDTHFANSDSNPYEIQILHADGTAIPVEVRSREVVYRGLATRVAAIADLRERKIAEEKIRHLAQHDPLSGLPNRAVFSHYVEERVKNTRAEDSRLAVLLIDLDHFKDINDLHGHAAGDLVIRTTGQRLKTYVGDRGIVARLGGDEFAILLERAEFTNQVVDFAHRLTVTLAQPILGTKGLILHTGASVGIALCSTDCMDSGQLLSRADAALYKAKAKGRNTYCVYEPGMDEEDRQRRHLDAELAVALVENQFDLHFQPRMATSTGEIISYEALIRWNHPEKGLVPPGDFIRSAEQSGRIVSIGKWVLERACRIAKQHLGSAHVSVNVSPVQFREKSLLETIKAILQETGLPPEQLEIEITENLLIDDDERALRTLRAIKKLGCRVALDDFGTGYSSLGYLSRFPFDCIKIDRTFVQDMNTSKNARAIVDTIIRLGRATDMRIVAEGVEQAEELTKLAQLGCDEIQGYLVGRPLHISQLQRKAPDEVLATLGSVHSIRNGLVTQLRGISEGEANRDTASQEDRPAKTAAIKRV